MAKIQKWKKIYPFTLISEVPEPIDQGQDTDTGLDLTDNLPVLIRFLFHPASSCGIDSNSRLRNGSLKTALGESIFHY